MADRILMKTGTARLVLLQLKRTAWDMRSTQSSILRVDTSEEWWNNVKLHGRIKLRCGGRSYSYQTIGEAMKMLLMAAKSCEDNMEQIVSRTEQALQLLEDVDERLAQMFRAMGQGTALVLGDPQYAKFVSDVFKEEAASDKKYGGNQGSPMNHRSEYDDYRRIIEANTGKKFDNDDDLYDYLKIMNQEGCGYTAMVNAIIVAYQGREQKFKETFGYDMYDANGYPNYDKLLVDIYSYTNNKVYDFSSGEAEVEYLGDDTLERKKKWFSPEEEIFHFEENGVEPDTMGWKLDMFLNKHNVANSYKESVSVTPENFDQYAQDGVIVVGLRSYDKQSEWCMYDSNGERKSYSGVTGHAMVVVGVDDRGRYIVSSWGETYYVDPNDCVKGNATIEFMQMSVNPRG
ncbi:MAG: hypothetical protein ACI4PG_08240 [Candidatus Ventricola sp.]